MKIYKKIIILLFLFITFLYINNNVFANNIVTFTDKNGVSREIPDFNIEGYNISNGYLMKEYNRYIPFCFGRQLKY